MTAVIMQNTMKSCQATNLGLKKKSCRMQNKLRATVMTKEVQVTETLQNADGEEIYLGFEKTDGFGSRVGRKGRMIRDDPAKYPAKDNLGLLLGVTGGWAGGEVALKNMTQDVKEIVPSKPVIKSTSKQPETLPKPKAGQAVLYVGFNKDELELRKSGAKGRQIVDTASKYPEKQDVGPLMGATGGFAGGEVGVRQFVETGDLRLRQPGDPEPRRSMSSLPVAGVLALVGAGGGLLFSEGFDAFDNVLNGASVAEMMKAPMDENTQRLFLAAVAVIGFVGAVSAARVAQKNLQESLSGAGQKLQTLAVTAGFWFLVFLVARGVLDS